jgi:hypothetical protein
MMCWTRVQVVWAAWNAVFGVFHFVSLVRGGQGVGEEERGEVFDLDGWFEAVRRRFAESRVLREGDTPARAATYELGSDEVVIFITTWRWIDEVELAIAYMDGGGPTHVMVSLEDVEELLAPLVPG